MGQKLKITSILPPQNAHFLKYPIPTQKPLNQDLQNFTH